MEVYEIRLKVFLLETIPKELTYTVFSQYIDSCMAKSEKYRIYHNKNCYKYYCFDQFFPIEADGIYKKEKIYTVRIRTVDLELADYFAGNLMNHFNNQIKGLTREIRVIPKRMLEEVYTITPAVIKCSDRENSGKKGYWKNIISFEQYERRLKENLIKKYNQKTNQRIEEDFDLYSQIEVLNRIPISIPFKGKINLLGDKLSLKVADNERAQRLAYFALGTGIQELNSRGMGFLNYKFY